MKHKATYDSALARAVLLILIVFIGVSGAHASAMTIEVSETTIRVANVSPGASIVLFSCSRGYREGRTYVKPEAVVLRDSGATGSIEYQPAGGVPLRTVLAAIDLETGATAVGGPAEFPLRVESFQNQDLAKNGAGEIVELLYGRPRLIALLVRPSKGAWIMRASDGDEGDRDLLSDGTVTLAFEDFRPVTETEDSAPSILKNGDVIVAIDPSHLDLHVAEVGE